MNEQDKQIHQLTRSLLKESLEQPTPQFNARIMAAIRAEKQRSPKVCYTERLPSLSGLAWGGVAYLLIVVGLFLLLGDNPAGQAEWVVALKPHFPLLLTAGSSLALFFLFAQLDGWLRSKRN